MRKLLIAILSATMLCSCGEKTKQTDDSKDEYKEKYETAESQIKEAQTKFEELYAENEKLLEFDKELNKTWMIMYIAQDQDKWLREVLYQKMSGNEAAYTDFMTSYYEDSLEQLDKYIAEVPALAGDYSEYKIVRNYLASKSELSLDFEDNKEAIETERANYIVAHEKFVTAILGHITDLKTDYNDGNG